MIARFPGGGGSWPGLFPERKKKGSEVWAGDLSGWSGRPLMFKRVNLISKASSNWRPSPDLSGAFSWRLGVKMVL